MHVLADQPQRLRRRRARCGTRSAAAGSHACAKLNGVGSASPGCSSNVSSRSSAHPAAAASRSSAGIRAAQAPSALSPSSTLAGSPLRPAVYCCSPQWISPFRNVPVVTIVAAPRPSARPAASTRAPSSAPDLPRLLLDHQVDHLGLLDKQVRCASSISLICTRYSALSHCARGHHTAGPREYSAAETGCRLRPRPRPSRRPARRSPAPDGP